jgi:PilZ domain
MSEARKAIRFPLEASVSFYWMGENGVEQQGKGRSRDISENGVFVFADECPPAGVKIGLKIVLPELSDIAHALRMQIEGRVLRVDEAAGEQRVCGFVVLSEQALLSGDDSSPN